MKFSSILSGIVLAITSVSAQVYSEYKEFSVTRPLQNSSYVAGTVLSCTYQLFESTSPDFALSIYLQDYNGTAVYTISGFADVTKTPESASKNDASIYEHSYTYTIPSKIAGEYEVVFVAQSSNTEIKIPINILPATIVSSEASKVVEATSTQENSSTLASETEADVVYTETATSNSHFNLITPSKAMLSILVVAAFAFTF